MDFLNKTRSKQKKTQTKSDKIWNIEVFNNFLVAVHVLLLLLVVCCKLFIPAKAIFLPDFFVVYKETLDKVYRMNVNFFLL